MQAGQIPALKSYGLDKYLLSSTANAQKRFIQYAQAQALERFNIGISEDRKDFFYYLLNAKDPETGSGLSTSELWSESATLIVAGSDTASTALAASFFYLGRPENISALNKLVTELKDTFNNVEEIQSGTKLNSCQYLRACIDEALRLSPPVPGGLPREVLAGGMSIDGEFIPARVDVTVPIYALHHNPSYFRNPEKFMPERWIKSFSSPEELQVAQETFSVFSLGPRGCIGKSMAYMELLITVARVVWLFEFRLMDGGKGKISSGDKAREGIFEISDYFVAEKDGPMMEVVERI
jgi:cytochrome P450